MSVCSGTADPNLVVCQNRETIIMVLFPSYFCARGDFRFSIRAIAYSLPPMMLLLVLLLVS